MKRNAAVIVATVTLLITLAACRQAPSGDLDPFLLAQRIASGSPPRIVDVRTPEEFAGGHVPGAINIPHDQLATRLGDIGGGKSDEIVVYCQKGGRAAKARQVLSDAGYTQARHLDGDMQRWREGGYPVE